jgi:hypothetical protein
MTLLDEAPDIDGSLPDWIAGMQAAAKSARAPFEPLHKRVGDRIRRFKGRESYTAAEVFGGARDDVLEADVIHRVKGESHDAVLLVAEPATGARDNARLWIEATDTGQVTEEVRVAYVALTRARRYCAVALPDDCHPDIVDRFVAAGFRSVDDLTGAAPRKAYRPPALPSASQRLAALSNGQLAAALDRWSRRSAEETAGWSRLLCEAAMPGRSTRARSWTVLAAGDASVDDPASDANPVWLQVHAAVDVDIELLDEDGAVSEVADALGVELALRLRAWLRHLSMRWGVPVLVLTASEALLLWSAARTTSRASEPPSYAAVTVRRRAARERSLGRFPIPEEGSCPSRCSMPPAAVAHPPRCRSSTPAGRRATRGCATRRIRRRSRRS